MISKPLWELWIISKPMSLSTLHIHGRHTCMARQEDRDNKRKLPKVKAYNMSAFLLDSNAVRADWTQVG